MPTPARAPLMFATAPDDQAPPLHPDGYGTPARPVRWAVVFGVGVALAALAGGLWVHWPWLRAEHARLPPALAAGVWCADGLAVAGLLWFGVRYGVLGRPLAAAPLGGPGARLAFVTGVAVVVGIDLASTAALIAGEAAGWNRAVAAPGQIVEGRPTVNRQKAYLTCQFQSPDGAWHEGRLQVRLSDQPAAVRQAVEGGRFPIPVRVSYDPEWPPRCWLDGFDNEEDNRLYFMSLGCLLFQGLCVWLAVSESRTRAPGAARTLAMAAPAVAELVPFALAAAGKFCEGEY